MNGWLIVNGFLHTKKFSELTDLFLLAGETVWCVTNRLYKL